VELQWKKQDVSNNKKIFSKRTRLIVALYLGVQIMIVGLAPGPQKIYLKLI
jgi:hypothetical protein